MLAATLVLGGLLASCGNTTRTAAEAAGCANNLRHLSQAWLAHGAENPRLLGNPQTGDLAVARRESAWAAGWLTWGLAIDNISTSNLQMPPFVPYSGRDTSVFRCPSDRYVSPTQEAAGWRHRARSYSMNGYVGPGSESWVAGFRKFSQMAHFVDPAGTFVFVDEHPDSINDPFFACDPTGRTVPDVPASLHGRGANLSFADGHVERRVWVGARFVLPVRFNLPFVSGNPDADSRWLGERASQSLP